MVATVDLSQHLMAGITVLRVTTGQRNSSLFTYSLVEWRSFDRASPQAPQPQAPGPAASWSRWASWPAAPGRTHVAAYREFSQWGTSPALRSSGQGDDTVPGVRSKLRSPTRSTAFRTCGTTQSTKGHLLTLWAGTRRQHPPVQPHLAGHVPAAQQGHCPPGCPRATADVLHTLVWSCKCASVGTSPDMAWD